MAAQLLSTLAAKLPFRTDVLRHSTRRIHGARLKNVSLGGKEVSEPLESSDPGTQKRRSTRIVQAVPITISGVDALGQPFKERTTTVMVNCHGCKYQSKHYVPKN